MLAEIKRLHTPEGPSLSSFMPEDPADFALLIQVMAGPSGEDGEESFDVEVVSPLHLARRASKGPISGRHLLIVQHFDPEQISVWLHRAVAACSGETWGEVASQLARIGRWEFEDYRE